MVTACRKDLGKPGWYFGCDTLHMAGGVAMWTWYVNKTRSFEWTIEVRRYVAAAGAWVVVLRANLPSDRRTLRVTVRHADISGTGVEELLVGYVQQGAPNDTDYDVVSWPASAASPVVRFDRRLPCGLVKLGTGEITEWRTADQGICPAKNYTRTRIRFVHGEFRVVEEGPTTVSDGSDF